MLSGHQNKDDQQLFLQVLKIACRVASIDEIISFLLQSPSQSRIQSSSLSSKSVYIFIIREYVRFFAILLRERNIRHIINGTRYKNIRTTMHDYAYSRLWHSIYVYAILM